MIDVRRDLVAFALPVAVLVLALRGVLDVTGGSNSQDLDLALYLVAGVLAIVALSPLVRR